MKKIRLLLFILLICLMSLDGAHAITEMKCEYSLHGKYSDGGTVYPYLIKNKIYDENAPDINGSDKMEIVYTVVGDSFSIKEIIYKYNRESDTWKSFDLFQEDWKVITDIYEGDYFYKKLYDEYKAMGIADNEIELKKLVNEEVEFLASRYEKWNLNEDSEECPNIDFSFYLNLETTGIKNDQTGKIFKLNEKEKAGSVYSYVTELTYKYGKILFVNPGSKDSDSTFRPLTTSTSIEKVESSSCFVYNDEASCKNSMKTGKVACVWNKNVNAAGGQGGYCNVDNLLYVGCGGASDIPQQIPALISLAVNLLKIATPIILIFVSIITLLKAMSAQKEDEIKKATSSLIKKIIAAVLVFFVIAIVQFIVSVVAKDEAEYTGFENCLNCFLNNKCETNTYYKTVVGGEDMCTFLASGERDTCEDLFNADK